MHYPLNRLTRSGRTVYFGPVGKKSTTLINYFESKGGKKYPDGANPAEWMLEVIGAAPGSHSDIDWHQAWLDSEEKSEVRSELDQLRIERSKLPKPQDDKAAYSQFAAPFITQYREVQWRVFQQYWRTPSYIIAKLSLCAAAYVT